MKPVLLLIVFWSVTLTCRSQYYLRGAVNDENGKGIYNARILLASKGSMPYYTGTAGAFGISLSLLRDSITISADGYETLRTMAEARTFQVFTLKKSAGAITAAKQKLASIIQNREEVSDWYYYQSGETYSTLIENNYTNTAKYPASSFALNIDRASYSNIRRFLNMGLPAPPDAVRIEEILNYFNTTDREENHTGAFRINAQLTDAPWNHENQLLLLKFRAPFINTDSIPPTNLVFLIDVSGSMDQLSRLPLLKEAFKLLVKNMRPIDTVSIVIYGGVVGIYLQPISCAYKDSIITAIEKLEAGGETPGAAAIQTAYALAERSFNRHSNNRIILATDGDFNVGQTSDKELEDIVMTHRQSGIYLTCLGVGMGNYKDSKLEVIAKKGNGNFAYIDNIQEAEKVLVKEFTKTLYSVANDATVEVKFNPLYVKRYRLIGFDNKKEMLEDSISELEGGEVGSGHVFTAVYEIDPAGYFNDSTLSENSGINIAQLNLSYKTPAGDISTTVPYTIKNNYTGLNNIDSSYRLATSLVMFGGLLKQSDLWKNYTWDDVLSIAKTAVSPDSYVQNEFINLAEKAKKIYAPVKRKKKAKE